MSSLPAPTLVAPAASFTLGPAISPAAGGPGATALRCIDLARRGDREGARAARRSAVGANSRYASTWSNLAAAALLNGDVVDARGLAERAVDLDPDCADALVNLALAATEQDDATTALELLRRAVVLEPEHGLALTLLAVHLRTADDLVTAADLLERAAVKEPRTWHVALELGRVARRQRRVAAVRGYALAALTEVLEALPLTLIVRPQPPKMSVAGAHAAIAAAHDVMTSVKLPFYPMAGTLLGLIRDGDLLPHDKDIDLAVPHDCDRDQLAALFERHPQFHVPPRPRTPPGQPCLAFGVIHRPSGITIDLFFARHEHDGVLFGFGMGPQTIYSRLRPYGFRQIRWLNRQWQIPSPPEQYLEDMYGPDWRTPDHYFDTALSNPSRLPESIPLVFDLGLLRLGDALQQRQWLRAHSLCRQLLARQAEPTIDALRDLLEQRCADLRQ